MRRAPGSGASVEPDDAKAVPGFRDLARNPGFGRLVALVALALAVVAELRVRNHGARQRAGEPRHVGCAVLGIPTEVIGRRPADVVAEVPQADVATLLVTVVSVRRRRRGRRRVRRRALLG